MICKTALCIIIYNFKIIKTRSVNRTTISRLEPFRKAHEINTKDSPQKSSSELVMKPNFIIGASTFQNRYSTIE
jgi:hypothetical protein